VTPEHKAAAQKLRRLVATYEAKRDLVLLGAYAKGTDKDLDEALARMPKIEDVLRQSPSDRVAFDDAVRALVAAVK
jgi:flagellar biosynthesis/type III secretory pathway ATPase